VITHSISRRTSGCWNDRPDEVAAHGNAACDHKSVLGFATLDWRLISYLGVTFDIRNSGSNRRGAR